MASPTCAALVPPKEPTTTPTPAAPVPAPESLLAHYPDNLAVRYWILPISRHPLKSCFTLFFLQFMFYRACVTSASDVYCLRRVGDSMTIAHILLAAGLLYATWLRRRVAKRVPKGEGDQEGV
ncbi:hypothetical protein BJX62DRAFT_41757 [Aspergillus germanicus]